MKKLSLCFVMFGVFALFGGNCFAADGVSSFIEYQEAVSTGGGDQSPPLCHPDGTNSGAYGCMFLNDKRNGVIGLYAMKEGHTCQHVKNGAVINRLAVINSLDDIAIIKKIVYASDTVATKANTYKNGSAATLTGGTTYRAGSDILVYTETASDTKPSNQSENNPASWVNTTNYVRLRTANYSIANSYLPDTFYNLMMQFKAGLLERVCIRIGTADTVEIMGYTQAHPKASAMGLH